MLMIAMGREMGHEACGETALQLLSSRRWRGWGGAEGCSMRMAGVANSDRKPRCKQKSRSQVR